MRSRRGSSHNRGRNRGRIEKSWGKDEKKMGNGLPLGQLSHLGTKIGLRRVSQHPGSGQNFVCPKNLVELPATFCRLGDGDREWRSRGLDMVDHVIISLWHVQLLRLNNKHGRRALW